MNFPSRHNLVTAAEGGVRKHFDSLADWSQELENLRLLAGHVAVPRVLQAAPGLLLAEHLPGRTLLEELEAQEQSAFRPEPWLALARWLAAAHAATGLVPTDGNLRNFLWDVSSSRLFGVDLEHYRPGNLAEAAAQLAAFLMEYNPVGTPVKRRAAQLLAERFGFSEKHLDERRAALRKRRAARIHDSFGDDFSFILLSGGASSRMGQDKAALSFCGGTFEALQLEKARSLHIEDVMISCGQRRPGDPRCVPDELPGRGPLGGLHACLKRARRPDCIVLGIDTPLVPPALLREMALAHRRSGAMATLAVHGEKYEPLVAVYRAELAGRILPLIQCGGAPVRSLLKEIPWQPWETEAPESVWLNCNTPERYQALFSIK